MEGGAAPDTVQSLQHEIEVIKAKIAQEREKIKVRIVTVVVKRRAHDDVLVIKHRYLKGTLSHDKNF